MTNSRATAKMVVNARKHPQDLFRKGEACPNQLCTSEVEPKPGSSYVEKLPGSRGYQGRLAEATCPGFTQSEQGQPAVSWVLRERGDEGCRTAHALLIARVCTISQLAPLLAPDPCCAVRRRRNHQTREGGANTRS